MNKDLVYDRFYKVNGDVGIFAGYASGRPLFNYSWREAKKARNSRLTRLGPTGSYPAKDAVIQRFAGRVYWVELRTMPNDCYRFVVEGDTVTVTNGYHGTSETMTVSEATEFELSLTSGESPKFKRIN